MMLKTLLFLPIVFLFFLLPTASEPQPEKTPPAAYGIICLSNDTDYDITYEYRWGVGEVQRNTLRPGSSTQHWWAYTATSQVSPAFRLSYDRDPSAGERPQSLELRRCRSVDTSCEGAKAHTFYLSGGQISIREEN